MAFGAYDRPRLKAAALNNTIGSVINLAMEYQVVVEAGIDVLEEIVDRYRGIVRKKLHGYFAEDGSDYNFRITLMFGQAARRKDKHQDYQKQSRDFHH